MTTKSKDRKNWLQISHNIFHCFSCWLAPKQIFISDFVPNRRLDDTARFKKCSRNTWKWMKLSWTWWEMAGFYWCWLGKEPIGCSWDSFPHSLQTSQCKALGSMSEFSFKWFTDQHHSLQMFFQFFSDGPELLNEEYHLFTKSDFQWFYFDAKKNMWTKRLHWLHLTTCFPWQTYLSRIRERKASVVFFLGRFLGF